MTPSADEFTQLLIRWGEGDKAALDRLMPLVYGELHRLAKRYMGRQNQPHTLQTTAVINEAYLKLVGDPERHWENRHQFFAVAARAMRQVLVDHARARQASKRGGEVAFVRLDEEVAVFPGRTPQLIALDDALTALAKVHPRQAEAIELRYFGGLSVEETAKALKVSPDTVFRDLRFAKAWLRHEMPG